MQAQDKDAVKDQMTERDRMEFSGDHPELRIKLRISADTARQRDADRFWKAYKAEAGGSTTQEDAGKTLRAAIKAKWVESPEMPPTEVDDMPPWKVRWMAAVIDSVYSMMVSVPKV